MLSSYRTFADNTTSQILSVGLSLVMEYFSAKTTTSKCPLEKRLLKKHTMVLHTIMATSPHNGLRQLLAHVSSKVADQSMPFHKW